MGDNPATWTSSTHSWAATVDHDHLRDVRERSAELSGGRLRHLVLEVLAYAAEEAESLGRRGSATVTVHDDGSVEVCDDGRGTDTRRDAEGHLVRKPVMATQDLRFYDADDGPALPDGLRRRGISVVAALSRWLVHSNYRAAGAWTQRYEHGVPVTDLEPVEEGGRRGTAVRFLPDETLVEDRTLTPSDVAGLPWLDVAMSEHEHEHTEAEAREMFEPDAWEERYSSEAQMWSGHPNAQLVAEVSGLAPGTALDVGCGEGGDVIWLAQQGWQVTGADFAANGLARAAGRAEAAGVADRVDWWQVDARTFDAAGRTWDLVTTHFLQPPDGAMVDVTRRLASAVAPGGHLLVVGHAPSHPVGRLSAAHDRAMFLAADLLPGLPDGFEPLVVEQRPRTMVRDGEQLDVHDSTLLARRTR